MKINSSKVSIIITVLLLSFSYTSCDGKKIQAGNTLEQREQNARYKRQQAMDKINKIHQMQDQLKRMELEEKERMVSEENKLFLKSLKLPKITFYEYIDSYVAFINDIFYQSSFFNTTDQNLINFEITSNDRCTKGCLNCYKSKNSQIVYGYDPRYGYNDKKYVSKNEMFITKCLDCQNGFFQWKKSQQCCNIEPTIGCAKCVELSDNCDLCTKSFTHINGVCVNLEEQKQAKLKVEMEKQKIDVEEKSSGLNDEQSNQENNSARTSYKPSETVITTINPPQNENNNEFYKKLKFDKERQDALKEIKKITLGTIIVCLIIYLICVCNNYFNNKKRIQASNHKDNPINQSGNESQACSQMITDDRSNNYITTTHSTKGENKIEELNKYCNVQSNQIEIIDVYVEKDKIYWAQTPFDSDRRDETAGEE